MVEAFVRQVLTIARVTTDWQFVHFSPQLWYLRLGDRIVPHHIIPMDRDAHFTRAALSCLGLPDVAIPHHNPSPLDLTPALASPIVSAFIDTFYAEDFAYLRSDDRLKPLASKPPAG